MQGYLPRRLLALALAFAVIMSAAAPAGEILSTMRNVNAVVEAHGFRLNIIHDAQIPPMQSDLSPAQAFEILRPADKPVTIGRLFTSCSCIQLESPKRTFNPGERAILTLRNIKPTPPAGQIYAVFVQITSPVRTTLRFDTYVQSGMAGGMPFDNPAGGGTAEAPQQQLAALGTSSDTANADILGGSHADAVAALTRQIDRGMATAPTRAPGQPGTATEARELPALPPLTGAAPAATTTTTRARTETGIEAREMPAPLPPPAELTAVAGGAEPPAGVALVPGAVAAPAATAAALPELPALTAVAPLTVPAAGAQTIEAGEVEEEEGEEYEEEDIDDFNPLLTAAPRVATTTTTTTTTATAPARTAAAGAALGNTLSVEELERELKNDIDELYSREEPTLAGGKIDQELLKRQQDTGDDEGTADLVMDLKDLSAYQERGSTTVSTAVQTGPARAAAQTAPTGQVATAAPVPPLSAPRSGVQIIDPVTVEELRAAADSLPPPPGLTSPEVTDDFEEEDALLYGDAGTVEPLGGTAYLPGQLAGGEYEEGVPEPRPARDISRRPVQAVSLITVGVRDMPASIRFYEALGWKRAGRGKYDTTAFFQLQGQILALYPMHELLNEQNMPSASPAPGGITLALHVQDREDVWNVYQRFIDAGGRSLRQPAEMASGAVTSYVADPDGNAWEISWVPQFRIDEEGGLWLP